MAMMYTVKREMINEHGTGKNKQMNKVFLSMYLDTVWKIVEQCRWLLPTSLNFTRTFQFRNRVGIRPHAHTAKPSQIVSTCTSHMTWLSRGASVPEKKRPRTMMMMKMTTATIPWSPLWPLWRIPP
jgi:hypothetical protein